MRFTDQSGIIGFWDANTGTMTLTGTATTAEYETALRSIRYENTSDNPTTAIRTIDFRVNDGQLNSNVQSRDVVITPINDASMAGAVEITALSYIENDGPRTLTSTLSLTDVDDTFLESANVTITGNYVVGQDVLAFIDQNGIQGNWDAATGSLTLSGSASLAQYEVAIRSVTFENISDFPDIAMRTVTFSVNDGDATSNVDSRNVIITSVNDVPRSTGPFVPAITVIKDTLSLVDLASVQVVDVDDNGQPLLLTLSTTTGGNLTAVANGGVTVTGSGSSSLALSGTAADLNAFLSSLASVQYLHQTPNIAGTAVDAIVVTVNDLGNTGIGGGTPVVLGSVLVDIANVNDAPVAIDDIALAVEDTIYTGSVLGNDIDIDGDALNAVLVGSPQNGQVQLNLDGTYTYTPALNYYGNDYFTYLATDGNALSNEATVFLTIAAVNDQPVANPNSYELRAGNVLSLTNGASILNNDLDIDGDLLTAVLISGPSNGTLVLNPDGSFLFAPEGGYVGEVSFIYAVTDGNEISAPATVTVNIFSASVVGPAIPSNDPFDEDDGDILPVSLLSDGILTTRSLPAKPLADTDANEPADSTTPSLSGPSQEDLKQRAGKTQTDQTAESQNHSGSHDPVAGTQPVRNGLHGLLEGYIRNHSRFELNDLEYALDTFNEDVRRVDQLHELITGTATTVFIGTTATAAVWLMNSTYFAALLSSSLPIWARFDPIYIVKNSVNLNPDDDTTLAKIISEDSVRGNETER